MGFIPVFTSFLIRCITNMFIDVTIQFPVKKHS